MEAASSLYDRLADAAEQSSDYYVHSAAIRLAMHRGETAAAIRHAGRFDPDNDRLYLTNPEWMFEAARALCADDDHRAAGEEILARLKNRCRSRPAMLLPFLVNRERARDEEGVRFVLDIIESAGELGSATAQRAFMKLRQMGETDRALAFAERQLEHAPGNMALLPLYAKLLLRARQPARAIEPLGKILETDPDALWARQSLARALYSESCYEDALRAVEALLARKSDDPEGLVTRARTLARLGRRDEAKESAKAAAKASDGDPQVVRKVQSLLDAA